MYFNIFFTDTLDSTGEATAETSEPVNVRIQNNVVYSYRINQCTELRNHQQQGPKVRLILTPRVKPRKPITEDQFQTFYRKSVNQTPQCV